MVRAVVPIVLIICAIHNVENSPTPDFAELLKQGKTFFTETLNPFHKKHSSSSVSESVSFGDGVGSHGARMVVDGGLPQAGSFASSGASSFASASAGSGSFSGAHSGAGSFSGAQSNAGSFSGAPAIAGSFSGAQSSAGSFAGPLSGSQSQSGSFSSGFGNGHNAGHINNGGESSDLLSGSNSGESMKYEHMNGGISGGVKTKGGYGFSSANSGSFSQSNGVSNIQSGLTSGSEMPSRIISEPASSLGGNNNFGSVSQSSLQTTSSDKLINTHGTKGGSENVISSTTYESSVPVGDFRNNIIGTSVGTSDTKAYEFGGSKQAGGKVGDMLIVIEEGSAQNNAQPQYPYHNGIKQSFVEKEFSKGVYVPAKADKVFVVIEEIEENTPVQQQTTGFSSGTNTIASTNENANMVHSNGFRPGASNIVPTSGSTYYSGSTISKEIGYQQPSSFNSETNTANTGSGNSGYYQSTGSNLGVKTTYPTKQNGFHSSSTGFQSGGNIADTTYRNNGYYQSNVDSSGASNGYNQYTNTRPTGTNYESIGYYNVPAYTGTYQANQPSTGYNSGLYQSGNNKNYQGTYYQTTPASYISSGSYDKKYVGYQNKPYYPHSTVTTPNKNTGYYPSYTGINSGMYQGNTGSQGAYGNTDSYGTELYQTGSQGTGQGTGYNGYTNNYGSHVAHNAVPKPTHFVSPGVPAFKPIGPFTHTSSVVSNNQGSLLGTTGSVNAPQPTVTFTQEQEKVIEVPVDNTGFTQSGSFGTSGQSTNTNTGFGSSTNSLQTTSQGGLSSTVQRQPENIYGSMQQTFNNIPAQGVQTGSSFVADTTGTTSQSGLSSTVQRQPENMYGSTQQTFNSIPTQGVQTGSSFVTGTTGNVPESTVTFTEVQEKVVEVPADNIGFTQSGSFGTSGQSTGTNTGFASGTTNLQTSSQGGLSSTVQRQPENMYGSRQTFNSIPTQGVQTGSSFVTGTTGNVPESTVTFTEVQEKVVEVPADNIGFTQSGSFGTSGQSTDTNTGFASGTTNLQTSSQGGLSSTVQRQPESVYSSTQQKFNTMPTQGAQIGNSFVTGSQGSTIGTAGQQPTLTVIQDEQEVIGLPAGNVGGQGFGQSVSTSVIRKPATSTVGFETISSNTQSNAPVSNQPAGVYEVTEITEMNINPLPQKTQGTETTFTNTGSQNANGQNQFTSTVQSNGANTGDTKFIESMGQSEENLDIPTPQFSGAPTKIIKPQTNVQGQEFFGNAGSQNSNGQNQFTSTAQSSGTNSGNTKFIENMGQTEENYNVRKPQLSGAPTKIIKPQTNVEGQGFFAGGKFDSASGSQGSSVSGSQASSVSGSQASSVSGSQASSVSGSQASSVGGSQSSATSGSQSTSNTGPQTFDSVDSDNTELEDSQMLEPIAPFVNQKPEKVIGAIPSVDGGKITASGTFSSSKSESFASSQSSSFSSSSTITGNGAIPTDLTLLNPLVGTTGGGNTGNFGVGGISRLSNAHHHSPLGSGHNHHGHSNAPLTTEDSNEDSEVEMLSEPRKVDTDSGVQGTKTVSYSGSSSSASSRSQSSSFSGSFSKSLTAPGTLLSGPDAEQVALSDIKSHSGPFTAGVPVLGHLTAAQSGSSSFSGSQSSAFSSSSAHSGSIEFPLGTDVSGSYIKSLRSGGK